MIEVIVFALKAQDASLKITDNMGKIYYEKEMKLDAGENEFTLERNSLPEEYYVYVYLKSDKVNLITRKK